MASFDFGSMFSNPKFKRFAGESLQDLGYGLSTGTNFGNALGAATQRMGQMQPYRDQQYALEEQKAKDEEMRQRYAETLSGWGPEYSDLANGLLEGGLDPAETYWRAWDHRYNPAGQGASAPANVQEWQYYSSLSPEDQSRYLTMKRSNTPLNTGTAFVTQDPANPGALLGEQIPIDNFTPAQDAALGKVIGDAAAQKIINLPQTLATADNMIGSIDGILNDPALDVSTGWLAWMQGVPGTEQYRFGQRALQLQGQAFLQAFESLKGGGQITQVEGEKATQAIGRLSTAQNPADYRQALSELRAIIETAKQRAQQGAASVQVPGNSALGGSGSMPSASGKVRVFNPATGRLE